MPAPRNTRIARHTIICSMLEAKPHRKLATVKPNADIANNSRVPSARDMNPDNGIAITSAIRYDVCTHDTSLELADSPAWISFSEAETIWMSRIDMNIPNTMIRNAISRRGGIFSGGGAAAFIIDGGVGASAMGSSRLARDVTADEPVAARRDRPRCRRPSRLRGYRRWCRPTCRRA